MGSYVVLLRLFLITSVLWQFSYYLLFFISNLGTLMLPIFTEGIMLIAIIFPMIYLPKSFCITWRSRLHIEAKHRRFHQLVFSTWDCFNLWKACYVYWNLFYQLKFHLLQDVWINHSILQLLKHFPLKLTYFFSLEQCEPPKILLSSK